MINSTLLEALGNKESLKEMINKTSDEQYYQSEPAENCRSNKVNTFKNKSNQRKSEYDDEYKESIDTVY